MAAVLVLVARASASADEPCRNPDAIGVTRTVEVDTAKGGLYGSVQYAHAASFLADKEVVLTFDDGPFPETTPAILEALAEQCTKATFFYVGRMALNYPAILAQVEAAGHTIAAHTWAHGNLRKMPGLRGQAEIERGISMLQARLGHPIAPFFRFPYLSDPKTVITYLNGRHIAVFSADVDSWDSHGRTPSARIVSYVMNRLKQQGHGIVLMHDIKHTTAAALPEILRQLKAGGYKIVHMVAKTPAVSLAHYDVWANMMIEQHDSGVAVASNDIPALPNEESSAPSDTTPAPASQTAPALVASLEENAAGPPPPAAETAAHAPAPGAIPDPLAKPKPDTEKAEADLASAASAPPAPAPGATTTVTASPNPGKRNASVRVASAVAAPPPMVPMIKRTLKSRPDSSQAKLTVAALPKPRINVVVLKPLARLNVAKPAPQRVALAHVAVRLPKPPPAPRARIVVAALHPLLYRPAWVAINDTTRRSGTGAPTRNR